MVNKRILLLLTALLSLLPILAQQMSVSGFRQLSDMDARVNYPETTRRGGRVR